PSNSDAACRRGRATAAEIDRAIRPKSGDRNQPGGRRGSVACFGKKSREGRTARWQPPLPALLRGRFSFSTGSERTLHADGDLHPAVFGAVGLGVVRRIHVVTTQDLILIGDVAGVREEPVVLVE